MAEEKPTISTREYFVLCFIAFFPATLIAFATFDGVIQQILTIFVVGTVLLVVGTVLLARRKSNRP